MSQIFVLMNPASGPKNAVQETLTTIQANWDTPDNEVWYQFSESKEDGIEKIHRAADQGAEIVLMAGGDGMLNSSLRALVDRDLRLGLIPTGSVNGFARHFRIPLDIPEAVKALCDAEVAEVDLVTANEHPWIVTCSFAWETSIVETFDKFPVRGVLPYLFSAAYTSFDFIPQKHEIRTSDGKSWTVDDPMVLTVVNISDYGAVKLVSPHASPSDGKIELVSVAKDDLPKVLAHLPSLLKGELDDIPEVDIRSVDGLTIAREKPAPIQIDGELVETDAEVRFNVEPKALKVLVPKNGERD